jgi:two-component system nitrogen regulation response regulator GlnG
VLNATLAAHGGHQHAAKSLGLSRNTMTRKLGSSRQKRS